jgi:type II secretory pathway pseudopilin PulG
MFQGSQKRARDNRRKTDLGQLTKALEMYANDTGGYPASTGGKIIGCTGMTPTACEWGSAWVRGAIYMQKLPKDPASGSYCYEITSGGYKLFAKLESTDDADLTSGTCNSVTYNYVLLSTNITPTPRP